MVDKKSRENYIRVTNILYHFSGLDKIDPSIVAKAGERGTKIHKICEGIITGLGELDIDEETSPYVESFKQWWLKGHNVFYMEERFWDDEYQITGQVDLIISSPDGLTIVDFKTSSKPSLTWPIQGAAYAFLAKRNGINIKKIQFLHLLKNGKEAKIYEYPIDDSLFLCILRTWQHFYQKGQ